MRNPKSEIRSPKQIRSPKSEIAPGAPASSRLCGVVAGRAVSRPRVGALTRRLLCFCVLLPAFCILHSAFCLRAWGQDYAIDWFTIDGGGGESTDGYYAIAGTIGQPDAGELSDGYYAIVGGFWAVWTAAPVPGVPGVDHSPHRLQRRGRFLAGARAGLGVAGGLEPAQRPLVHHHSSAHRDGWTPSGHAAKGIRIRILPLEANGRRASIVRPADRHEHPDYLAGPGAGLDPRAMFTFGGQPLDLAQWVLPASRRPDAGSPAGIGVRRLLPTGDGAGFEHHPRSHEHHRRFLVPDCPWVGITGMPDSVVEHLEHRDHRARSGRV